jgi:hypothetical protein
MILCMMASIIFRLHVGMMDCQPARLLACNSSFLQACWSDDVTVIMKA